MLFKKNPEIMVEDINNRRTDIALDIFSQQFYFYLSIYLSISISIYLSTYISIFLSTYLSFYLKSQNPRSLEGFFSEFNKYLKKLFYIYKYSTFDKILYF